MGLFVILVHVKIHVNIAKIQLAYNALKIIICWMEFVFSTVLYQLTNLLDSAITVLMVVLTAYLNISVLYAIRLFTISMENV